MKLIAFTGKKGSGKDTAANIFIHRGYVQVRFAGALKVMIKSLLHYQQAGPLAIEAMVDGEFKENTTRYLNHKTPRHAMQTLGTEWARECMGENFWVEITKARIAMFSRVVVTDVRFENEVKLISDLGGTLIRIYRPSLISLDEHPSETAIGNLKVDLEIVNDGDIEDLHDKIRGLCG